jgi:hypothetical protein
MRHRLLISLWLLCAPLFAASSHADGLQARLDRTRLAEGETLVLQLSAPGDSSGTPDLTPLEPDFDVLSQSQSSRISIINGNSNSSSTKEWQLVLAPKHTGKLQIPALSLAGLTSQPLSVEVLPAAQADKLGEARPLALEVEASTRDPYVQGQVVYTVRVLARVPLRQASLSEPDVKDALIERLGEDKQYATYRNGQRYQVIERRYAIFPQHSGKLQIEAPLLTAQVPETGRQRQSLRQRMFGGRDPFADMQDLFGRDPFGDMGGFFAQTRPMQVRGQEIELQVRPQPDKAGSPWLPAESLSLAETWSPDPPVFRVGEPVTRTISITAQGLSAAQLPDLNPQVPEGIKVYPDKAQNETRGDGDTLIAQKVLKSALLPSQPGALTLPEVRLAWWDTQTDQQKTATLPARTVQVLPAPAGSAQPRLTAPAATPARNPAGISDANVTPGAEGPDPSSDSAVSQLGERLIQGAELPTGYWPWIAAVLGLAWLATTILWLRARNRNFAAATGRVEASAAAPAPKPGKALNRLQQACKANDAKAARQALLEWAAARWPEDPPRRLETLGRRLGEPAGEMLRTLDQELYAPTPQGWDGVQFWRRLSPSLEGALDERKANAEDGPLPPLYSQSAV